MKQTDKENISEKIYKENHFEILYTMIRCINILHM